MTQEEALNKILNYIEKNSSITNFQDFPITNNKIHEIIIEKNICLVQEISWSKLLEIENSSVKISNNNLISSEMQKRQILKTAILKIQNENHEDINFVFEDLNHTFVEKIWAEYQKYLHLSAQEAQIIYNSAKKYFDPDNNEFKIINPLIIQVDYMTKGILHFTFEEFNNLKNKDFEAIQLILACKNEAIS